MKFQTITVALLTLFSGAALLTGCTTTTGNASSGTHKTVKPELKVMITQDLARAQVKHRGKQVTVMRNQDIQNLVSRDYEKTSRKCPPFCIEPFSLGHGVQTIGELEVIKYATRMSKGNKSIILIDTRNPEWLTLGTIPGSINIPYTKLSRAKGAIDSALVANMKKLGVKKTKKGWNFKHAKTAVLFCNGAWCHQSTAAIEGLLAEGYPGKKLKWYRGGMQSWELLGLTTVVPETETAASDY